MEKEKYLKYFICLLLSFLILSIIILSWTPPVSRDALTHHLAVPKLYLQHGGIYEIPSLKFSYYPMNLELLYLIPMYLGNDIFPKLIHFLFALATALIIFIYLKNRLNILYGLFGALLFLSTPVIIKLSITAYVDLGLVFFSIASLILILKWSEERYRVRYLFFSAICCGLALGIKYNGLVILFILTLFIPIIYLRKNSEFSYSSVLKIKKRILIQTKAMGFAIIFFIMALVLFSPWMIRNYIWKKNPIYPLYENIINSPTRSDSNLIQETSITSKIKDIALKNQRSGWNHFTIRRIIYRESWWQIAFIPIRIFFQGEDGNPKYFDGKLNPLLFILALFAFIFRKNSNIYIKRDINILLAFSIAIFAYTFVSSDMRIRYISPILPPLAIISVFGLKKIEEIIAEKSPIHYKKYCQFFVVAIVSLLMLVNIVYLVKQFLYVKPFEYICGKVSRDAYITKFRPEYPVIEFANKNLPEASKILGVFMGNRRYYSDRDMVFNDKLLLKTVNSQESSRKVLNGLKNRSITHMIIWVSFFSEWARQNFNKEEFINLQIFFKQHTKVLYTSGGYTLFQILDNERKVSSH